MLVTARWSLRERFGLIGSAARSGARGRLPLAGEA
jgi:hypothetical protein